jgi:hypothetical protein
MTIFALATALLPVSAAQAAPAPSVPPLTSTGPAAGSSFSPTLYGKGAATRVEAHGCPVGDVCMYTTAGWKSGTPENEYYYYACYNLSNEYGTRYIYNNQVGNAWAAIFSQYNCFALQEAFGPQGWGQVNITVVNSIKLYKG